MKQPGQRVVSCPIPLWNFHITAHQILHELRDLAGSSGLQPHQISSFRPGSSAAAALLLHHRTALFFWQRMVVLLGTLLFALAVTFI